MFREPQTKVLTFQTWVSRWDWYSSVREHREDVPQLLVDRSPCQDPFLDQFAPNQEERRPLISGLCRLLQNFEEGDRFAYVTRPDGDVCIELGLEALDGQAPYLGVASMVVTKVWRTHREAAASFEARRYVAAPLVTPYPPNLAHTRHPVAAAARESSIVHHGEVAFTPAGSTPAMWEQQYLEYHVRQLGRSKTAPTPLRVAECRIEVVGGVEAIQLSPETAAILTMNDWGGGQMNVGGRIIDEDMAGRIRSRIAAGRS